LWHVTRTRDLLALRVTSLWRLFRAQGFVYWAMCCYLLVEYVRPQQLISSLNFVPVGQIVLGAAVLAHVGSGRWFAMKGLGSWLLLAFTAVILLSSLTAYNPSIAVGALRVWLSWVVIYFLIITVVNTEQRLLFFTLLWLLFHFYMAQGGAKQFALRGFTFIREGALGAPGWFRNSGEFGIAMCMFLAIAWHYYLAARPYLTKWRKAAVLLMPLTAIVSIVGSSSRGAVLGLGAVGVWSLLQTKHRVRSAVGLAALITVVWLIVPPEFKARFSAAGRDPDSINRLTYWKNGLDMARGHPLLGVGYENWQAYYTSHYVVPGQLFVDTRGVVQVPHNIFIECVAELGYVGLSVFVLLILATLRINAQTRKHARAGPAPPNDLLIHLAYAFDTAMISYLVCGFFVTVLYYPFFWINLAFTVALGAIAQRTRGRRVAAPPGHGAFEHMSRRGNLAEPSGR